MGYYKYARLANSPFSVERSKEDEWLDDARCATLDGKTKDFFFSNEPREMEMALGHCRACPVIEHCLAEALDRKGYTGIMGGKTSSELRQLRRHLRTPPLKGEYVDPNSDHPERFRQVKDFPNYRVGDYGTVHHIRTLRVLTRSETKAGIRVYMIDATGIGTNRSVARLMAEAFVPEYTPKCRVILEDGDPHNLVLDNLLVMTDADWRASSDVYYQIRESGKKFSTVTDAARHIGVTRSWLSRAINGAPGRVVTVQGQTVERVNA